MTTDKNEDFYKLHFAQREGKAPLPEVMELEHVPQSFRQHVWLYIDQEIKDLAGSGIDDYYETYQNCGISQIIWLYRFEVNQTPHDEIPHDRPSDDRAFARESVLFGKYHEVITFVEYILRHKECSADLYKGIQQAFARTPIAYSVEVIDRIPTIVPRVNRESGEATRQAIETISVSIMDGAATHLRQAAQHINSGQYPDAVADSIHAVESVACTIDPRENKTLGPALDSLGNAGLLQHPALKEAFKKLYGYTSDEEGIRHALVFKRAADVGLAEAILIFSVCASFAAYLIQKDQKIREIRANGT